MSGRKAPTDAQRGVIAAVAACEPSDSWGEVYSHFESTRGTPPEFEMRNFDRSAEACESNGWILVVGDVFGMRITTTPSGRAALKETTND